MRVTIVVPDNVMLIDGKPRPVDCSDLAYQGIHAIQWYDDHGEIEYVTTRVGGVSARKQNLGFNDLAPYQHHVDAWRFEDERLQELATKAAEEAERTKEQRELDAITVMSRTQNS